MDVVWEFQTRAGRWRVLWSVLGPSQEVAVLGGVHIRLVHARVCCVDAMLLPSAILVRWRQVGSLDRRFITSSRQLYVIRGLLDLKVQLGALLTVRLEFFQRLQGDVNLGRRDDVQEYFATALSNQRNSSSGRSYDFLFRVVVDTSVTGRIVSPCSNNDKPSSSLHSVRSRQCLAREPYPCEAILDCRVDTNSSEGLVESPRTGPR